MLKSALILLSLCCIPALADVVNVSPDKLDFGSQFVGFSSAAPATLTNPTKKALNISNITAGGDFSIIYQDCGSVLAPYGQCTIYVQFSPTAPGARTATLTISDDATNSPQKVKLSGNGIPVQLVSINVTPGNASAPLGLSHQFTAIGLYNNGTEGYLTPRVLWASSNPAVVIDASGLATSSAQGISTISATLSGVTGSTQLTITAPVVQSITVTPNGTSIPKGLTQQFTARGTLTNRLNVDLTSTAQWSSSAPSTVSVNATGLATGLLQGATAISATSGGVTGWALVSVTAPVLTSRRVSPTNISMGSFTTRQFSLIGTYSDSSTADLTSTATWSSTNTTVATVDSHGLVNGTQLGWAVIQAQVTDGSGFLNTFSGSLEVAFASGHPTMSTTRGADSATLLRDGRVLLAGGWNANFQTLTSTDIFDPRYFQFTPGPVMSIPRVRHTGTILQDGTVLIAGGGQTPTADLYNPVAGTLLPIGDLNVNRFSHTATLLNNGQVLIAGGDSATAELYDPSSHTFTLTGVMTISRTGHTATLLNDGRVLIAGGSASTMVELYDPATGLFTAGGTLTTDRTYHAAARLADGRVLIIGGQSGLGYTSSVDLYDPATGIITPASPMRSARAYHTATLLYNGQVLVAGGRDGQSDPTAIARSVERFDPTRAAFTGSGDMATYPTSGVRVYHTATLLQTGQVLLAGGLGEYPNGTAETYQPSMPNPPGLQ